MMIKRMLIFICLIAYIGSTFAEVQFGGRNDTDSTKPVDCKTDEHCCLKSAAGGCAKCCPNKLDIPMGYPYKRDDMGEMNGMKQRDDPDWTKPDECKASEHCCRKSAAGGCAKCCPNKIQFGAF